MSRFSLARTTLIATLGFGLLALAGCQSEEEKAAERNQLKSELREEILRDLSAQVPGIVRDEFRIAVEAHKRDVAEQAAKAKAAPAPVKAPTKPAPKKK